MKYLTKKNIKLKEDSIKLVLFDINNSKSQLSKHNPDLSVKTNDY